MQTKQQNLDEWLRHEAHIVTGDPFQMGDYACVPVVTEAPGENERPVGFLLTHGSDLAFVPTETPDGAALLSTWNKMHLLEIIAENETLPTECWYG